MPKKIEVIDGVNRAMRTKAKEHPTEARLNGKTSHHPLQIVRMTGRKLRQDYRNRRSAFLRCWRCAKAKQFRWAGRKLELFVRWVQRDLEQKLNDEVCWQHKNVLILAERVMTQEKKARGKTYMSNAPKAECIASKKAHQHYEFGVKTNLVAMSLGMFTLGAMPLLGNPFDGHVPEEQLEPTEQLERCLCDALGLREYMARSGWRILPDDHSFEPEDPLEGGEN